MGDFIELHLMILQAACIHCERNTWGLQYEIDFI